MPPRRGRKLKSLKGRVAVVKTAAQWDQVVRKSGKRFLLVHFGAAWCVPCKKMRPVISDISKKSEFNQIAFAEVDVDRLQDLATKAGVKTLPTFQMWANGEPLETVTGGTPMKVIELLQKYSALVRQQKLEAQGGWKGKLVKGLAAGAALAAAAAAVLLSTGVVSLPNGAHTAAAQSAGKGKGNQLSTSTSKEGAAKDASRARDERGGGEADEEGRQYGSDEEYVDDGYDYDDDDGDEDDDDDDDDEFYY